MRSVASTGADDGLLRWPVYGLRGLQQSYLQLRYIEALEKLALSDNSKVVVLGNGEVVLPSFDEDKDQADDKKKKKKTAK